MKNIWGKSEKILKNRSKNAKKKKKKKTAKKYFLFKKIHEEDEEIRNVRTLKY